MTTISHLCLRSFTATLTATLVQAGVVKDAPHTSGTCGNGLDCPPGTFEDVDCFQTLLNGRCTYSVGNTLFIAFTVTLICIIITCMCGLLYCYCCRAAVSKVKQTLEQSDRHEILVNEPVMDTESSPYANSNQGTVWDTRQQQQQHQGTFTMNPT